MCARAYLSYCPRGCGLRLTLCGGVLEDALEQLDAALTNDSQRKVLGETGDKPERHRSREPGSGFVGLHEISDVFDPPIFHDDTAVFQ